MRPIGINMIKGYKTDQQLPRKEEKQARPTDMPKYTIGHGDEHVNRYARTLYHLVGTFCQSVGISKPEDGGLPEPIGRD